MSNIIYRGTTPAEQTGTSSADELSIAEMDNNFFAIDVATDGTAEAKKALIVDSGKNIGTLGTITTNNIVVERVAPATAGSTGTAGEIAIANGFLYVCVATNTWQRVAIATW